MKGKIGRVIFWGMAIWGGSFHALGVLWRPQRLPGLPDLTEPGMRGDACNTCHVSGGGTARNPFGLLWERTYPGFEDFEMTAAEAFAPVAELDPDGDSFTNAVELALGTHPGNASSRPLRFTRPLTPGWNTLSLPLDPRRPFRVRDLLETVGTEGEYLIRWDSTEKRFVRVDRTTSPNTPENVFVDGQSAFLVWMRTSKEVSFVGRAWTSSRIRLEPGLNFVALPRKPVGERRLAHLAGDSGFGVALVGDRFTPCLPSRGAENPGNVPLKGAEGYFIFSTTRRDEDFGGAGWSNE